MSTITTTTLTRKRKRTETELVVRLSTPHSDVDADAPLAGPSSGPLIIINGALTTATKRKYRCQHEGCNKAYTKPSRLEEHERSHTGERPFVCTICNKSYFRETHLQAHARSHLPESERPFVCAEGECGKRFWTSQRLRVHEELHRGEKAFKCTRDGCTEAFTKHHQLRAHICEVHSPSGTKAYQCTHAGCPKSFATNQKLRAHMKVHDEKRYTCVHPSCRSPSSSLPTYYPTWTALQAHVRNAHPPTCPYAQCNGKTFMQQKGLRAHMKLHAAEDEYHSRAQGRVQEEDVEEDQEGREEKRRRGGEWGREWVCEVEGCEKDFKSKKALGVHVNVAHLGKRDHVCEQCGVQFGYKHLLQRHAAKRHAAQSSSESDETQESSASDSAAEAEEQGGSSIDFLTGKAYADKAMQPSSKTLKCPHPNVSALLGEDASGQAGRGDGEGAGRDRCAYFFTRAYDLRRHLMAVHGVDVGKKAVDWWVAEVRAGRA